MNTQKNTRALNSLKIMKKTSCWTDGVDQSNRMLMSHILLEEVTLS